VASIIQRLTYRVVWTVARFGVAVWLNALD
jgi:hypothetical protein